MSKTVSRPIDPYVLSQISSFIVDPKGKVSMGDECRFAHKFYYFALSANNRHDKKRHCSNKKGERRRENESEFALEFYRICNRVLTTILLSLNSFFSLRRKKK